MVDRRHYRSGPHCPARAALHRVLALAKVFLGDCGNIATSGREGRMA
jgi:hypothetical protein